jgi:ribosome-binding factor A
MSIRTERVASLIKEEISLILARDYGDPGYGFITVTAVKMTADLKIARIALSILGKPDVREKTMHMLEAEKQHIRGILGSHIALKYTPALQFYLDESLERADRINRLIQQIHRDDGDSSNSPGE